MVKSRKKIFKPFIMKKIFCGVLVCLSALAFAQKKEIDRAYQAITSNNTTAAASELAAAEAAMGDRTYLLDPSVQEKFYYTKGMMLVNQGKVLEGAKVLAKIGEMATQKIYTGKDAQRNRVYYIGKAAAAQSGISGLKEQDFQPETAAAMNTKMNGLIQKYNQEAVDAYNAKNYAKAGDDFSKVYFLLLALGADNKQMYYNAGISYTLANKHAEAVGVFKDLIDAGYTGQEITYLATNKKTGQVERMDKSTFDLYKKMGDQGDYKDFKVETSPNIQQDLYETYAGVLNSMEKYDDLIAFSDVALKKFPKSEKIIQMKSMAYYKSGKEEEFVKALQSQVDANPGDKVGWYNLGVMLAKNPAKMTEAQNAFDKAVSIDPQYAEAWQNMVYNAIGDDAAAVKKYRDLSDAKKFDEANKVMEARKQRMKDALLIAERWYKAMPNNAEVVSLLKGMYQQLKMEDKAKEMSKVEASLGK